MYPRTGLRFRVSDCVKTLIRSADGAYGYGLHWWHGRFAANGSPFKAITALGWGGQRVFIVPEKELSVTVFSSNFGGDWLMAEKILAQVVASVTDSQN